MIKHGIRFASVAALALIPATMAGPAAMASPAAARDSAPVAWVVNQSVRSATKGSVTPIDTATNTVIKKIPVSRNAIAVTLAPDGKTAWVALNADRLGGRGRVIPVSTTTYHVGKPIEVGSILPQTMAITPNGKTLYVGDWDSGFVTPIRTASGTAGRPIATGLVPGAVAMAITPDGRTLYVVNQAPGTVTPIDTATNTAGRNIKVGRTPSSIVVTPDGQTAYVLNLGQGEPGKGTVTPISTATNTMGKPIPIKHVAFPDAGNLLVMAPDGKTVYAVGNTTVTPISTATNMAGKNIHVAPRLGTDSTVAITPDGGTVYVGGLSLRNSGNFVVPVTTATGAVGKAIVVRGEPHSMAVTPDGKTVYVVCAGDAGNGVAQDVIPISTATNKAGPAIDTDQQPQAIAISR